MTRGITKESSWAELSLSEHLSTSTPTGRRNSSRSRGRISSTAASRKNSELLRKTLGHNSGTYLQSMDEDRSCSTGSTPQSKEEPAASSSSSKVSKRNLLKDSSWGTIGVEI